jgi:hypothetical protein
MNIRVAAALRCKVSRPERPSIVKLMANAGAMNRLSEGLIEKDRCTSWMARTYLYRKIQVGRTILAGIRKYESRSNTHDRFVQKRADAIDIRAMAR